MSAIVQTVTYAAHAAYLEPMSGEGVLALPLDADDVMMPGAMQSLHADDWDNVMRDLYRLGFMPSTDDEEQYMEVGVTADGRSVIGLGGSPLGDDSIPARAAAWPFLREAAGIVG